MKQPILFLQGGGEGAHEADARLVASLRMALGAACEMHYPRMPREDDPDYARWKPRIASELSARKGKVIVVGHSLGGSFLLKYLCEEKVDASFAGIFLLAAPYWGGDGWRYDGYERVALPTGFASRLPSGVPIFLYHCRDDSIAPFAHLALYQRDLPDAIVRALDRGGHQLNNDLSGIAADIKALKSDQVGLRNRAT